MDNVYRLYCRIAVMVFVSITAYTVIVKLLQGRLADDWLHSVLHLGSGLAAADAGWYARGVTPARAFTWGVGLLYFALGVYGWFTAGLLVGTPFAIPLGVAENVFHLALSVPALAILALDVRRAHRGTRAVGRP